MFRRVSIFTYGIVSYAIGFGALLYLIVFMGGYGAPTSLDGPLDGTAAGGLLGALIANLGLCLLFALQHSVMARPAFKRRWTKIIPPEAERSTYLVATGVALGLLFWQWRPMGGIVWEVQNQAIRNALHGLYFAGWGVVFMASFLINHFDLFGLRQVWLCLRGKPYTDVPFSTPMLYSAIRHPIYTGMLIGCWSAPTMGAARLAFALAMTAYILFAYRLEERDLIAHLGERYTAYRRRVPALLPRIMPEPRTATQQERAK